MAERSARRGGARRRLTLSTLPTPQPSTRRARGSSREHGTPDILINNAGAGRWLPMLETTAEEALAMIEVPYLAAFNLTRAFLPDDDRAPRAAPSPASPRPRPIVAWPKASAYIAARRAVAGLAETLAAPT